MKDKSRLVSLAVMCALSAGNIAFVESGIWQVGKGKAVDISGMGADAYQVTGLSRTGDGSYIVQASAAGFQSDISVEVKFDTTGEAIQEMKVVAQAESDGIGTQVTGSEFAEQFAGADAPVTLKGKELAVVSPVTGESFATASAETAAETGAEKPEGKSDPAAWKPEDQSAEAAAQRALYAADLTRSAAADEPLTTPAADGTAEEKAVAKLGQAGLLTGAANETVETEAAGTVSMTELDAVSGATISSTAVVTAVNNAYFFLHEAFQE